MNVLRYVAVIVTLIELCVLCAYYFPLVAQVPWFDLGSVDKGSFDDNFVSDLLNKNKTYLVLVTIFVVLQVCMCIALVIELNRMSEWRGTLVLELMCLISACVGWFVLISFFTDGAGHLTVGHIFGTVLFIVASGLYFVIIIVNMVYLYTFTTGEGVAMFFSGVAFVVSVFAGSMFFASFFDKGLSFGWMYEHIAFIFLAGAHVLLFVTDTLIAEQRACGVVDGSPPQNPMSFVRIVPGDLIGTMRIDGDVI